MSQIGTRAARRNPRSVHGKHDDQVDSTLQALDWSKTRASVSAVVLYYRDPAEEGQRAESQPSTLHPRVGLSEWTGTTTHVNGRFFAVPRPTS